MDLLVRGRVHIHVATDNVESTCGWVGLHVKSSTLSSFFFVAIWHYVESTKHTQCYDKNKAYIDLD